MASVLSDFGRVALRYPGRAAAIAYWFAVGRRVRARGRLRDTVAQLPFDYGKWMKACTVRDCAALGGGGSDLDRRCVIAVHLHLGPQSGNAAKAAISSVLNQTWPHWRLLITRHDKLTCHVPKDSRIRIVAGSHHPPAAGLAAALKAAPTAFLVPLVQDCRLPRGALAAYAAYIKALPNDATPVIYGDEDEQAAGGTRARPWFKPDWDSDMFLAQDYLSAACALPVVAAREARAIDDDVSECAAYALLLRLAVVEGRDVHHVHRVTASRPAGHWRRPCAGRIAAVRRIVTLQDEIQLSDGAYGTVAVQWPLPATLPLVSIIVPTRDRLDLLRPCIEGVLEQTRYPNFEIVIADNGSVESDTRAFLSRISDNPRVRVVSWPHAYNYSAINNFAVKAARGEFICLLNNDIEIIDGDWLGELMRHACRSGVGAVGARLLYPDRSIQHAGVVVGMGNAAGHAHRGLAEGEAGYFAQTSIARAATAVTAACLVVSRALFDAVGGLDEQSLKIAYNDVDFCLKLRASGVRNIYVPSAVLIHHESKSRGLDQAPEHLDRYMEELAILQKRWDTARFLDPTHHPVLSRFSETYLTV